MPHKPAGPGPIISGACWRRFLTRPRMPISPRCA